MSLKKFSLLFIAMLALGAVLANSASATITTEAAELYEGPGPTGTTITGSRVATAEILKHTNGETVFQLKGEIGAVAPKVAVELTATGLKCVGCTVANKIATLTNKEKTIATGNGKLEFTGVTAMVPKECFVKGENGLGEKEKEKIVTTRELTIHADFMHEGKAYVDFFPTTSGSPFATLELFGPGCSSIAGPYNVTGSVKAEAKNKTGVFAKVQELEVSQAIQTTTGSVLKLGNNPAELTGTAGFRVRNAANTADIEYAVK